jgi:Na+-translocating ferredoxin:NAD+ oxidoreductase RnfD subunit
MNQGQVKMTDKKASRPQSRIAARNRKKQDNGFKKFMKTPKGLVFNVLLVLMVLGVLYDRQPHDLINVGAAVGTGIAVDLILGLIQKKKRLIPDGAMVTALIISLVLSASAPWYQAVLITLIALASKHIIAVKRKPIFNPAAFGLLASIYLFHSNQSWWGGLSLLPVWCIIILIIGGFLIAKKVNKFPQVFTFLGIYFLLFILMTVFHYKDTGVVSIFRDPFVNSALFLSFIMLTDPPTSPAKYRHQFVFGLIAAVISVASYVLVGGLSYLFIGLLIANAWKAWQFRNPQQKKSRPNGKALQGA